MSRDERNRRISELREPSPVWNKSATNLSDGGSWVAIGATLKYKPRDWQKDAAWPTLLREARLELGSTADGKEWNACPFDVEPKSVNSLMEWLVSTRGPDPADAVCEAWLKWKSRSGSEATL